MCKRLIMLQAVSVIGAHHVIRVAILRALRYSLGYSQKTWIFRISRSSADAIGVIRAGHYAAGVIPNIHSCANSVMNLAGALITVSARLAPLVWWPAVTRRRLTSVTGNFDLKVHNEPNTQRSSSELSTDPGVPGIREYYRCRGN